MYIYIYMYAHLELLHHPGISQGVECDSPNGARRLPTNRLPANIPANRLPANRLPANKLPANRLGVTIRRWECGNTGG